MPKYDQITMDVIEYGLKIMCDEDLTHMADNAANRISTVDIEGIQPIVAMMRELIQRVTNPRFDAFRMQDILANHWATETSGCSCNGVPLGASWTQHITDLYQAATQSRSND